MWLILKIEENLKNKSLQYVVYKQLTTSSKQSKMSEVTAACTGRGMHNRVKASQGVQFTICKGVQTWSHREGQLKTYYFEVFGSKARLPWSTLILANVKDPYVFNSRSGGTSRCLFLFLKLLEHEGVVMLTVSDDIREGLFGILSVKIIDKVAFDHGMFPTVSGFRAGLHKKEVSAFVTADALVKAWSVLGFYEAANVLEFDSDLRKRFRDKDILLVKKRVDRQAKTAAVDKASDVKTPDAQVNDALVATIEQEMASTERLPPISHVLGGIDGSSLHAAVLASVIIPVVQARPIDGEPAEYQAYAVPFGGFDSMLVNFSVFGSHLAMSASGESSGVQPR